VVPAVVNSADNDDEVHGFLPKLRLKRYPAVAKTFSLLIFFLSVVALWASVSSAVDSQKATSIAEWTSKKDFFLYCEDVRRHYLSLELR
jgi:hypothetical protein